MSSSDGIEDDDRHSVASAGPSYVRASSVLSILSSSSSLTDPEQLEVVASTTTTSNTNNDKAKKKRAPRKSKAKDGTADAQKGKNGIAKEKKQQKQDKVAKSKKPAGSGKKGQQRKADGKAENDGEKEQESQEELSDLDDDEDEEDELIEVNEDGSSKAISIVGQLLRKTPNEPKHRWETAVSAGHQRGLSNRERCTWPFLESTVKPDRPSAFLFPLSRANAVCLRVRRAIYQRTAGIALCSTDDLRV